MMRKLLAGVGCVRYCCAGLLPILLAVSSHDIISAVSSYFRVQELYSRVLCQIDRGFNFLRCVGSCNLKSSTAWNHSLPTLAS